MTVESEQDPTKGIIDIEHFAYYIIGYLSKIIANPPKEIDSGFDYDSLEKDFLEELEELGLFIPQVRLENCPWETVPESIQTLIKRGYAAAELPEEKHVEVFVERGEIFFRLESPSVKDDIDLYGETSMYPGVGLQISDDPVHLYAPIGMWFIHQIPAGTELAMRGKTVEEKKQILKRSPSTNEEIPHTLSQLHDLVRFFEQSQNRAVVYPL